MKILTSWPAWAMMICHTSSNWGQYTIMTLLPKYLADYQGFNIKSSNLMFEFSCTYSYESTQQGFKKCPCIAQNKKLQKWGESAITSNKTYHKTYQ